MDQLTAVIVTHNSEEVVGGCIAAVRRWTRRILVVDNASTDRTLQRTDGSQTIANRVNRGFAGAANQGFENAETPFVLLLNPDVTVGEGRDELMEAASEGAAAGPLRDANGQIQAGFSVRRFPTPAALSFETLGLNRFFPGNPVNRRWRCLDLDLSRAQEVEQPAGAFLLVRRDAWASIGGFDDSFHPIWFEDVDFCLRLRAAGWKIRYTPGAKANHRGAHSIAQLPPTERQVQWYVSLLKYAVKHFGTCGRVAVAVSVALSSAPRAVVGIVRSRSPKPLNVCARVLKLAFRSLTGRLRDSAGPRNPVGIPEAVVSEKSTESDQAHLHVP
jgi:N-acetylglucosaminyl-diphospho-decaprenol L-rhamnosyltransferase